MGSTGEKDEAVKDGNKRPADINYDVCILSSACRNSINTCKATRAGILDCDASLLSDFKK